MRESIGGALSPLLEYKLDLVNKLGGFIIINYSTAYSLRLGNTIV